MPSGLGGNLKYNVSCVGGLVDRYICAKLGWGRLRQGPQEMLESKEKQLRMYKWHTVAMNTNGLCHAVHVEEVSDGNPSKHPS